MKTVRLKKNEDRRIRRGHPWAFSNELADSPAGMEPGELVRLTDSAGRFVGTGYINPRSLIAVRLVTRVDEDIDLAFIKRRVLDAKKLRDVLCPGRRSYRAFFSESDLLPGLVVDRYEDWLSVQSLTAGVERMLPDILAALNEAYSPTGIVIRNDSGQRTLEGLPLEKHVAFGEYPGPIQVDLNGLRFMVDVMEGQKTGFFLDQVDNYHLLAGIARGAGVLDLFCHTGAWSIAAASYGAGSCLGIDSSESAVLLASGNAALNGLGGVAAYEKAEVFELLKGMASDGRRYDVVVCDPPAFIKSRAKIAEGIKGYRDLNTRAMRVVAPGGWLISCSCSHHMDRETFLETLRASAAGAGRTVRLIELRSQSKDHPALLAAPETEYLKCVLLQVL